MSRILVAIGAILCAAALASPAAAGLRHFHGNVSGGGTVDFDVLFKRGKPVKAGNFDITRIPVSCKPTNTRVNFSTARVVEVRKREFSYEFRGFWAWISGKIRPGGKVAVGNVSYGVNDIESTGRSECTTGGPRSWRARL